MTDIGNRSETDAARFATDGYAVLDRFLPESILAPLRGQVQSVLERPQISGCQRPNNHLVALRWSDQVVRSILGHRARQNRVSRAIAADDLRWISGYVTSKEPGSAALPWHQDWWCWDHPLSFRKETAQVALLCYLSETTERTGALRVLAGSHRRSMTLHALLPDARREILELDHPTMKDQPGQKTIRARPGDAVILDYRLVHGTHEHAGPRRRDCVLLSFAPSWRDLPDDVCGHLIQHPALPSRRERESAQRSPLGSILPDFDGEHLDLAVNVDPPVSFSADG